MKGQLIRHNIYSHGNWKTLLRRLLGFHLGEFYMYPPRPLTFLESNLSPKLHHSNLKVSLVTPVLNQSTFIGQAIESVLSQQLPELEYIVMDGGSKDGTIAVIERYQSQLKYFESAKDKGQSDAINKGFARSTGDILGWLNADDLLLPGSLDYVVNFFEMNPDIDVIYGNRIVIDANGDDIGRWEFAPHSNQILSWIDYVPQETLFWRRALWDRVGGRIDTSFQFAMDWDLLIRFRDCGARFAHLPRHIGAFRVHREQKTSTLMNDIGVKEMDKIRSRCLGYVPSKLVLRIAIIPYVLRHIAYALHAFFLKKLRFEQSDNKSYIPEKK